VASIRVVLSHIQARVSARDSYHRALVMVAPALVVAGCGGQPKVPVDEAAENIRKLALGYVQYAAANRGVGPADQAVLEKFLVTRHGFSPEEAKACFVSPRDNQPFMVRWSQRPSGSGPIGPNPPKPAIIIAERNGADGTRYTADGLVSVKELPASEVSQLFSAENADGR
jgi:hypothetical protein